MKPLLSVVVPVYNEEKVVAEFHGRLSAVLSALEIDAEIVYVNDGSSDKSLEVLKFLLKNDSRLTIIDLSRNFGKEYAMTAGINRSAGDVMIVIDADLQDPPELIPLMLGKWRDGADVVLMKRVKRRGESFLKKITASMFYKFMKRIGDIGICENVGDFRLMSRKVVDALKDCPENTRFMKGLFAWVGFRTDTIEYERDARAAGSTSFNYWKLWNLAWDGIVSFSTTPLKISTYIGLLLLAFSFAYSVANFGLMEQAAEYAIVIAGLTFVAGLQLLVLGIMGEYLSRIAIECKRRPLYIVDRLYYGEGVKK